MTKRHHASSYGDSNERFWSLPRTLSVLVGLAIVFLWALYMIPYVFDTPWFESLYPFEQYALVSVGSEAIGTLVAGPLVIGGFVYFAFDKTKLFREMMVGLAGFVFWSWFVDETLAGPFYEAPNGTILIPLATNAQESQSSDGAFAQLFNDLGIHYVSNGGAVIFGYSLNYLFTYVVVPVLGIAVALMLAVGPELFALWEKHQAEKARNGSHRRRSRA